MEADYKAIKCKLNSILYKDINYEFLQNTINRTNNIIFITSHFIRGFILFRYKNNLFIPVINKEFISSIIKFLSKSSSGPKLKDRNNTHKDSIKEFYNKHSILRLFLWN